MPLGIFPLGVKFTVTNGRGLIGFMDISQKCIVMAIEDPNWVLPVLHDPSSISDNARDRAMIQGNINFRNV